MVDPKIEKEINGRIEAIKQRMSLLGKELMKEMDNLVKADSRYVEEVMPFRAKKSRLKKKMCIQAVIGMYKWKEDFIDEDSGEVISIDRSELVTIDGKSVKDGYMKSFEIRYKPILDKSIHYSQDLGILRP